MTTVPNARIGTANACSVRPGDYVLYWMIANRRVGSNFALQRARDRAQELGVPLLVLEALRIGHRWSSERVHRFVVDGMADNVRAFAAAGVQYYPYVEPNDGAGQGLLEALAKRAALVVTDHFPCYFLPRMVARAGESIDVALEVVDSNGILPLSAADRAFTTAHSFRRFLQKNLRDHLIAFPEEQPLAKYDGGLAKVPVGVTKRWPAASEAMLTGDGFAGLPFAYQVPATGARGGAVAGGGLVDRFVGDQLDRYATDRNSPHAHGTSGLSPYLHFGHVSSHEFVGKVLEREDWDIGQLAPTTNGSRNGWWGLSESVEGLLDQVVTWRELGYVFCDQRPDDYHRFDSLPDWAQTTLGEHASDPRPSIYSLEQLDAAATHDELWNAAQRQLVREGVIHNYLRMLWGKKILEWSKTPEVALDVMVEFNNRYALDGRNPNSYSGIFWVLGRFDRAWGPVRPIYGKIRYMSSDNTARKLRVREYLETYSA